MRAPRLIVHIFPALLLVTLLSLLASTLYTTHEVHDFYVDQTADALKSELELLLPTLDFQGAGGSLQILCQRAGQRTSTRFTIITPEGRVLADSLEDPARMENHAHRPEVLATLGGAPVARAIRYSTTRQQALLYVTLPLRTNGTLAAIVRAARPVQTIQQTLRSVQGHILFSVLAIALLAATLSYYLSWRITRPIRALRSAAEHYARGEFDHRLPPATTEEMASLGDSMKYMARQLNERIQSLSRERAESEAVLASMIEGVLAVNHDEVVIRINRAAAPLLGVVPEQALGRDLREVVRHPGLQEFVLAALASDTPIESDLLLYTPDERHVAAHGTALRYAGSARIGALVVLNDVTRIRRLEDLQREFVANVSHELKTPITAIQGFVETLLGSAAHRPEDVRRFLEIVSRHTERLNSIIEDLLSLSRIEQEEPGALEREDADLRAIVANAVQLCHARSGGKDIAIENLCAEPMPARVNTRLIEQALVNLLDNAVKFSPAGRLITITGARDGAHWTLAVRDQGCGIAAEHLPHLFERFYRVDQARSRQSGGTGLGLAIVKHIALAHGGTVSVQSAPGQGSTFRLQLPA